MILTSVMGDCPKCGLEDGFGNSYISGNNLHRGCTGCTYRETIRLPRIQKKILYLDQFFYSCAFKGNDKFVEALERIEKISSLQLLVTPFSSIHEDETQQWTGFEKDLSKFIKSVSRGHSFKPAWEVHRKQIVRSFKAFCAKESPEFRCEEADVLKNKVHDWDGYMSITSNLYGGDIKKNHEFKCRAIESLVNSFDDWRNSQITFDDDVANEIKDQGKAYLDSYLQYITHDFLEPDTDPLNRPIMSTVVKTLGRHFPKETSWDIKFPIIARFFESDHFANTPYQRLSARIVATFKERIKNNNYTNREKALKNLRGHFYDLDIIATYAPYCDAIFIDEAMAGMIAEKSVGIEKYPQLRIFCANKWDELYSWLDDIEVSMSEEHKRGLSSIKYCNKI